MNIKDLLKRLSPAATAAALLLASESGAVLAADVDLEMAAKRATDDRAPTSELLVLSQGKATGQLAQHHSHRSHRSHSSHRSHYSNVR